MGPDWPEVISSSRSTDQVKRWEAFRERHPNITITSPRQNGTQLWRATWASPPKSADDDGAVEEVTHYALRFLLDHLEARFDAEPGG